MIQSLTVENIALITRADITLQSGLTAITGETGAGKSLLIDSLLLALGGRAESHLVRSGAPRANISLLIDLKSNPQAEQACAKLGIELDDHQLLIQRDLTAEGRSSVRLNGRPVTVGMLKSIGHHLVDLHSQNDHRNLLDTEKQLDILDGWIGEPATILKNEVQTHLAKVRAIKARIAAVQTSEREQAQRIDLLQFQIEEISDANVVLEESSTLKSRLARLVHAQKLGETLNELLQSLSESEGSAAERVAVAARDVSFALTLDPSLAPTQELVETAESALQEAISLMRHYVDQLEFNPAEVEATAARLDLINRLKKKYGESESAILEYLATAQTELEYYFNESKDETALESELQTANNDLETAADSLTLLRKQQAKEFSKTTQSHIRDLALKGAEFHINFTVAEISDTGRDSIEYFFTANPGEPPQPLHKIGSGGELSRVMLAIKVACAGTQGIQTLIFDEIDTGLSGRAAAITARKLQQLSETNQVIVISHLAQVAAAADHHIEIEKSTSNCQTKTQLKALKTEQRPEAIAKLLAGENIGASAMANANEILQSAQRPEKSMVRTG